MGMIFISHSSRNNGEAVRVRDWLVSNGWGPSQIFLDLDALGGGERWRQRLDEIGNSCEAVIVCLSDDWIRSPECTREFTHAESRGKPIFPIIVAPLSEQIPRFVSDIQFVNISDPAVAETGFEKLKLGLTRAQIGPNYFAWPPLADPGRIPYRGLKALEEEDAAIFFGRDVQISAGLDVLRQMRNGSPQRILTIAAASGAGKSSFLKAGLLARLRRDEENFLVMPTWRPGRDALNGDTGLVRALRTSGNNVISSLLEKQAEVTSRLAQIARGAGETWTRQPPNLVLPLDQAEELFSPDCSNATEALNLLVKLLREKPDLLVIATIRTDSLGGLQSNVQIAPQLQLFSLPALPPSAFKEVIEGPAALSKPAIRIEPVLTERLIADLDRADALPLLAFTLERLVAGYGGDQTLTLQDYEGGLGGIGGAIDSSVQVALKKAQQDPALRSLDLDELTRSAFIPWLVQLDDADASLRRRSARIAELPGNTRPLIQHFIEERLLVSQLVADEATVEVSHEAVLRHWPGLSSWIGEERIVLERLHRVQRAAKEWAADMRQHNRSDMLVHRGERLKLAEELLDRRDLKAILNGLGADYLAACRSAEDASAAKQKRQRWRTGMWQAAATLILIIGFSAVAYAGWFLVKEQRAFGREHSLMLARIGEQFLIDGDRERAFLLSVLASRESALLPSSPEGRAVFQSAAQSMAYRSDVNLGKQVVGVVFSNDQSRILTWSGDRVARLWDATTGNQIGDDLPSADAARFSKDQSLIVTWSANSYDARVWDAATAAQIGAPIRHTGPVKGAVLSSDGSRILTWSGDRVWNTALGAEVAQPLQHASDVHVALFFQNDRRILSLSADNTARVWDAATGVELVEPLRHEGAIRAAALSKDASRILTWSEDNTVRIWESATGNQLGPTLRHDGPVNGATYSKDETRILTWSDDSTARIWDAETGKQEFRALLHQDVVIGAAFSKDEKRILTWSADKTAQLWDADTGNQIGEPLRHERGVLQATFSKDGSRILTRSENNTARIWDSTTATQIGPTLYHEGQLIGATFSNDESRVLTWGRNNTARFWDIGWWEAHKSLAELAQDVCTHAISTGLADPLSNVITPAVLEIDETIVGAAPILRGREGEAACVSQKLPWWDMPLQKIIGWTKMN